MTKLIKPPYLAYIGVSFSIIVNLIGPLYEALAVLVNCNACRSSQTNIGNFWGIFHNTCDMFYVLNLTSSTLNTVKAAL